VEIVSLQALYSWI